MKLPYVREIQPLLTVAGIILNTSSLVKDGIKPEFTHLLLPSLLTTFGGPIIANSVYRRFFFSLEGTVIYAAGFAISLYLYSSKPLIFFIQELPLISKAISAMDAVASRDKNEDLFPWLVVNSIAGLFLRRLVLKKSFKIHLSELLNIVLVNAGLFVIKKNAYPPILILVLLCIPGAFETLRSVFKRVVKKKAVEERKSESEESHDSATESSVPRNTLRHRPRRKASIANILSKSGKL